MKMNFWVPVITYVFLLVGIKADNDDIKYYWKDYTGVVPKDAFKAGKDISGNDTYIGQAYIHGHGLAVAQISNGEKFVTVAMYGVKKRSILKILCNPEPNTFEWLRTNGTHLHVDTIGKHPVIGGYDLTNNKGILYIGQVMYQRRLTLGSVAAYDLTFANLCFPHKGEEKFTGVYEVLIYKQVLPIDLRVNDF